MQYPFIVNMYTTFQDESYLYMVLEYSIGGEFFTHLRKVRLLVSFLEDLGVRSGQGAPSLLVARWQCLCTCFRVDAH